MMKISDIPDGGYAWCRPDALLFVPLGDASHNVIQPEADAFPEYSPENHVWVGKCPGKDQYGYVTHADIHTSYADFERYPYANEIVHEVGSIWETVAAVVNHTRWSISGMGYNNGAIKDHWFAVLKLYLETVDLDIKRDEREALKIEFGVS